MKTNNISQITDQQTITSMEIAEITGKDHAYILKSIRKQEPAWTKEVKEKYPELYKLHEGKFDLKQKTVETYNGASRLVPFYVLTKTECLYIATKFKDDARAALVLRWEKLEKDRLQQTVSKNETPVQTGLQLDPRTMTRKQFLLMALKAEEENERLRAEKQELEDEKAMMQNDIRVLESDNYGLMIENGQQQEQIKTLKERTAYLDVIMCDNGTVTVSQIAQDYGMSGVAFNNLLKGLQIQRAVGGQWLLYAEHLNKGYVAGRMIPIHHAGGRDTFKPLTVWTQTGRRFLYEKLKKHGVLPLCERTQPTS